MAPFATNLYPCRVTSVTDGDTLVCEVDLGFRTHAEVQVRLLDAWCPETRTTDPTEKAAGLAAKGYTQIWVDGYQPGDVRWPLALRCEGKQSFARWLGHITCLPGRSLSADLVAAGHATAQKVAV